ncbi:MAG TPA: HAD family hydrolase [Holophaga sp.]|nr:HAD family hydrolase [Holophaga sp.]
MLRAVVFDLWNTLVHSRGGDPFRHLGAFMTPEQIVHLPAMERDAMSRRYESAQAFLAGWRVLLGLGAEQHRAMAEVLEQAATDAECYPEAQDALAAVRSIARTALLSNTQSFDMAFLERLELAFPAGQRFLSAELGVLKPDRAAFEAVQARMGLFPGELAMVGDSWDDDVRGALDAGWTAIWLNRDGRPRPAHDPEADLIEVRDLAQVPVAIAALQAGARCNTCLG